MRSGVSATVARRYMLPFGILPRMGLLACGWVKPGDEFKRADDRAWWSKKYAHPLWAPLETYATSLDAANAGSALSFDSELAKGDSSRISERLAMVSDDLAVIRQSGSDVCAPYFIPARVGVLPVDNLACQTRLNIKPITDEIDKIPKVFSKLEIPWWVWLGLAFVITKKARR